MKFIISSDLGTLSQQGQNVLRVLVGDRENVRTRLHENLGSRQLSRFLSKVGVTNRALGVGQVDECVVQGVLIGLESRSLERTQSTTKAGDFVDHIVDDLGRTADIIDQRFGGTASQFI